MKKIISNKILLNIVALICISCFIITFIKADYTNTYAMIAYVSLIYVLLYQFLVLKKP